MGCAMNVPSIRSRLIAFTLLYSAIVALFYLDFYPVAVGHDAAYQSGIGFRYILGLSAPLEILSYFTVLIVSTKSGKWGVVWRRISTLALMEIVANALLVILVVGVGTI